MITVDVFIGCAPKQLCEMASSVQFQNPTFGVIQEKRFTSTCWWKRSMKWTKYSCVQIIDDENVRWVRCIVQHGEKKGGVWNERVEKQNYLFPFPFFFPWEPRLFVFSGFGSWTCKVLFSSFFAFSCGSSATVFPSSDGNSLSELDDVEDDDGNDVPDHDDISLLETGTTVSRKSSLAGQLPGELSADSEEVPEEDSLVLFDCSLGGSTDIAPWEGEPWQSRCASSILIKSKQTLQTRSGLFLSRPGMTRFCDEHMPHTTFPQLRQWCCSIHKQWQWKKRIKVVRHKRI